MSKPSRSAKISCHSCDSENRPGAKFCGQCGAAQFLQCLNCDNKLHPAARFCDECGTAVGRRVEATAASVSPTKLGHRTGAAPASYTPKHLADRILSNRSAMEGERKHVTVMFVDLQGSVELAEQVDPELWHGILDEFFSLLGEQIHRFEGTINQYTGDGVMALFGAPIAHEDHAQRACFAALALQKNLRSFSRRLRLEHELNVSVRTGINSGEVVVGRIGDDLRMDYTAQGHAVGLAARMESLAEPGEVYLTQHTAAVIHGFFELENLGAMRIKGAAEPLEVFVLKGEGGLKTRLDRSLTRGLSPYVGRESERQALQAAWQSVLAGNSQVLAVCGDAGLGKSRFCYEFGQQLRSAGVEVHSSTAVPYSAAMPNLPIKNLLRSVFGLADSDSAALARQKVVGAMVVAGVGSEDCRQLIQDFLNIASEGESTQLPPERRLERLGRILPSLLLGWSAPRLLVIEDLHWLDPASSGFLQELISRLPETQTLLLLNYRPEFDLNVVGIPEHKMIKMQPLQSADMAGLATALLGGGSGMGSLAERIARRAAGSPFFVEETIHSLHGEGWLLGERGEYEITEGSLDTVSRIIDEVVPDNVQAILAARIDALPQLSKRILQTAAVIGHHFTIELLASICDQSADELRNIISGLEALAFVKPHQDNAGKHFDFMHPVTLEVAYGAQLQSRRALLHEAVAKALEVNNEPGPSPDSSRLAGHWEKAGNLEMAGLRMMQAGQFAAASDMHEAASRLRKAIAWLSEAPQNDNVLTYQVDACSAFLRIASFISTSIEEVNAIYAQAQGIVERLGNNAAVAGLYISYGSHYVYRGDPDGGLEYIEKALLLIRAGGFHSLEASLRLPVLVAYYAAGRVQEGLDALQEPDGSIWGDSPITVENYQSRGMRAILLGLSGQLRRSREEMLACLAENGRQERSMSWVEAQLVEWSWHSGDYSQALDNAERAVAEAESFGSLFFLANAYRALIDAHLLSGNTFEAKRALELSGDLLKPGRSSAVRAFGGMGLAQSAEVLLQSGAPATALKVVDEAVQLASAQNDRLSLCRAWWVTAQCEEQLSDYAAVERAYAELERVATEAGIMAFRPRWIEGRASLAALRDETERAKQLLNDARQAYFDIGAHGHVLRLAAAD